MTERIKQHLAAVYGEAAADKISYQLAASLRTLHEALGEKVSELINSVHILRFLCSLAILLSLAGVPVVQVHSLFGSRNSRTGAEETGRYRTNNRRKFDCAELETELARPDSVAHQVFAGYRRLLACRINEPAFHPGARQGMLDGDSSLFALERTSQDNSRRVLCLYNVTENRVWYEIEAAERMTDLVSKRVWAADHGGDVSLDIEPYAALWLRFV